MRLIDRRLRWSACALATIAITTSAVAQHARLPVKEIAQIADAALRIVVPPDLALSGVPIATRQIAFDVDGTLAAFGVRAEEDTAFHLERIVTVASPDILSDCSQIVPEPCAHLGRRARVTMTPVSVTRTRAAVQVIVSWAARSAAVPDTLATGKGFLEGFAAKLYFIRRADGAWAFDRQDRTVIAF